MLDETKRLGGEGCDGYGWLDKLRRGSDEIFDPWREEPENGEQILGLTQILHGYGATNTKPIAYPGSSPELLIIVLAETIIKNELCTLL